VGCRRWRRLNPTVTLIQLLPWTPTCHMEAAARLIVVTCTAVGLLERGYLAEGRTGRQGLDA
jgi:hypothetical protein